MTVPTYIMKIIVASVAFTSVAYMLDADAVFAANTQEVNNTLNIDKAPDDRLNGNLTYKPTLIPDPWDYGYFIHPSIVQSDIPIFGHKYWMGVTPYPYTNQSSSADQKLETPCLYYSDDGLTFADAANISNPLIIISPPVYNQSAYGSDPEIVYCSDNDRLYYYYVIGEVFSNYTAEDVKVKLYDGKEITIEYNCSDLHGVSPAVIYDDKAKKFYMWIIDINCKPHQLMRYESINGINYTNETAMDMSKLYGDLWHMDVCYNQYDQTYCMLITFAGKPDLWLASAKNITDEFTLYQCTPVVYCANISDSTSNTVTIYRSTGVFNNTSNTLDLWLSVQKESNNMWHIVHATAKKERCDWKYMN